MYIYFALLTPIIQPLMAIKQIDHGTEEYNQMISLRHELLRKPLNLEFEADELDKEKSDILIGAFEEEKM